MKRAWRFTAEVLVTPCARVSPLAGTRDRTRSPIEIDGVPATEGFRLLPDGRNLAEVRIPSHNVSVTITSPDAGLAAHLAEFEIYIAD